jgi:hypothetical protein
MFGKRYLAVAAVALLVSGDPAPASEARLPIFDTHVHFSRPAWDVYKPEAVARLLDEAGVTRALVSSTPDDGTLLLHRHDPRRFVPELRPYHGDVTVSNWTRDAGVVDYIAKRLQSGVYRGIGEFHLLDAAEARTPQLRRLAALAVERDIVLHVHSDAAPVRALFAIDPALKVLWAHAGMSEPADIVGALLDRYPRLWAEVSFRAHDIAPGGTLDAAWRALLVRHADRFMIGTDTYIVDRWDEYGGLVDEHRQWLNQLPGVVARAIAHENAEGLFGR